MGILVLMCMTASATAQVRSAGPEFQINTSFVGTQFLPDVAMQRRGKYLVTWSNYDHPRGFGVWAQRFRNNRLRLGDEFVLTTAERNDDWGEFDSASACTDDGLCTVGWTASCDGCGDEGEIRAKIVSQSGETVVASFEVSTAKYTMNSSVSVARTPSGTTMIVWDDSGPQPPLETKLPMAMGRIFRPDGSPATQPFPVAASTHNTRQPRVSASGDNEFVVAWWGQHEATTTAFDIFVRRFSGDGDAIGQEFRVNEYTTGAQSRPAIAATSDGGFLATWESPGLEEDFVGIYARRFDSKDVPVGSDQHVNTFLLDSQVVPTVVHDGVGGFLVAWVSLSGFAAGPGQDGDGSGVFGRRLKDDGTPDGLEFQINTYTKDVQGWVTWPIGLAARDGKVVAVWQSQGQDSWDWGVFGRRFVIEPGLGPLCGDAHAQDLELDIRDAVQVLRSSIRLRPCLKCLCDTDGSGMVTADDSLAVLKSAVGVSTDLQCPTCEPDQESPAGASGLGYP